MVCFPGRLRPRRRAQAGFLLPLSLSGALVLLLSSLSLQAAVLHGRQLQAAVRVRQQAEDRLASAAHRLTALLLGSHRCVLLLDSSLWRAGALPADCPPALDLELLRQIPSGDAVVELQRWQPRADGSGAELWLRDGAQQRRYRFTLAQARGLQEQS